MSGTSLVLRNGGGCEILDEQCTLFFAELPTVFFAAAALEINAKEHYSEKKDLAGAGKGGEP
jgi:hypothetical protein